MATIQTEKAREIRIQKKLRSDKALKRHVEGLESELNSYRLPKIKVK
jgi:hypothetical protein